VRFIVSVDLISLVFFSCVSVVTRVVLLYSIFYMGGDIDYRRFVYLLVVFVASMFFFGLFGQFFFHDSGLGWFRVGVFLSCGVLR